MNATQYEQSLLMRLSRLDDTRKSSTSSGGSTRQPRINGRKAYGQRLKLLETVMEWFLDEQTQLHSALGY